ncbi:MAG TPA: site-2 protease family protein [bacterium]
MDPEFIDFLKTKMTVESVEDIMLPATITGRLYEPAARTVQEIKEYFAKTGYVPLFREQDGKHLVLLAPFRTPENKQKIWLNIILFIATIITTLLAGAMNSGYDPFSDIRTIAAGIPFSFSIMAILTAHELGHYFVSRKEGMITTLPFFIPIPFHFIGTFGAIIRMKSIVPSRRALLKVGMAGPLTGFAVALPIAIIGLALSEVRIAPAAAGYLHLGDSLLFYLIGKIFHPSLGAGTDIFLHPMAFAGWLGFFVTAINLIPIGQLDGGHVAFSILQKKRRYLYIPIIIGLIGLGLLWLGWYFWGAIAFFLSRRDPVVQDSITPLTSRDKLLALMPLVILILTFIPRPFSF